MIGLQNKCNKYFTCDHTLAYKEPVGNETICEEIMNIDFDEDKKKLPTISFLKYSRELSTYP